jgi:hypothetical protein
MVNWLSKEEKDAQVGKKKELEDASFFDSQLLIILDYNNVPLACTFTCNDRIVFLYYDCWLSGAKRKP